MNSLQIPPLRPFFQVSKGGGFVENFHQIENDLRPINEIFKSSVFFFFCSCSKNLQNRPKFSRKIDDIWQEIQNSFQISNMFLTNMVNIGNLILFLPIKILVCPIFLSLLDFKFGHIFDWKISGFEGGICSELIGICFRP